MNPVSLAMDGLLAVLLTTAVAIGVRLNGKLKLLRESQGTFVKAVADLDGAAARAEAGLVALRGATQEAHDQLLTRIETARTLAPRLERASEEAATAAARLEDGVRAADSAARRAQAAGERAASARPAPLATASAAQDPEPLLLRPAAEPIPFPSLRPEPGDRGLAAALAAADRIVHAETPPPPRARVSASGAAPASAPNSTSDSRLARFVARRQGARA